MTLASHEVWSARRPAIRWTGLAALVLLAACGGERRGSPDAGTEGAAVTDSTAPTATDTSTAGATRDTIAKQQAQRPGAPAAPAKPAKPATTAQPATTATARDTATTAASPPDAPPGRDTAAAAQGEAAGETQTADAPVRDQYHQAPKDTVNQATYDGWKQYNLNCARCHGEDVLGTTIGADLLTSLKADGPINTPELFTQVVCAGRPEKGMPSWCALGMEPAKINQIYSYVKGRSEGKIRPGRPSVKPEG